LRLASTFVLLAALAAAQEQVNCRVAYVAQDAVYVDAGSAAGLQAGDLGVIRHGGVEIAAVEVVSTTKSQARVRLVRKTREPEAGDPAVFKVRDREPAPAEPKAKAKAEPAGEEPFVPLLEHQKLKTETSERNIFHGRISLSQLFQLDNEGGMDYSTTILGTHGMLDRIGGSPWSLRWSGNLSYRTGPAFDESALEGGRLDLYDFSFLRKLQNSGYVRLGRLVPRAIQAAGYLDGALYEQPLGAKTRLGGALGFKPTRDELQPTADEPTAIVYGAFEAGERGGFRYSGTTALLVSTFSGDLDRTALLFDQFLETGKTFRINATAEVDFDTGASLFHEGTRLTRLDVFSTWQALKPLAIKAGLDHYERLDTAAERDMLGLVNAALFADGFWRYWAGAAISMPARTRLDLEYAVIDSESGPTTKHWRGSLAHYDPFGLSGGAVTLTVYNLESFDGDGVGGLLDANLPITGGKWFVRPALGFRAFDVAQGSFDVTDVRLQLEYIPGAAWSLRLGLSYLTGTAVDSFLVEFGASYRW
jgi:hypothetical protein